jgi:hypothetical protein
MVLANDQAVVLNLAGDPEGAVSVDSLDAFDLNTALQDGWVCVSHGAKRGKSDGTNQGFSGRHRNWRVKVKTAAA